MQARVQEVPESGEGRFFLPIGDQVRLEADIFSLAQSWNWTPEEITKLPYGRRKRAIRWHKTFQQKASVASKGDGSISFDHLDIDYIWNTPLDVL